MYCTRGCIHAHDDMNVSNVVCYGPLLFYVTGRFCRVRMPLRRSREYCRWPLLITALVKNAAVEGKF